MFAHLCAAALVHVCTCGDQKVILMWSAFLHHFPRYILRQSVSFVGPEFTNWLNWLARKSPAYLSVCSPLMLSAEVTATGTRLGSVDARTSHSDPTTDKAGATQPYPCSSWRVLYVFKNPKSKNKAPILLTLALKAQSPVCSSHFIILSFSSFVPPFPICEQEQCATWSVQGCLGQCHLIPYLSFLLHYGSQT